ncbi:MAG: TrkA, K+ transport system, NAD-binding component [Candidatus Methanohalarchaeum thermophilum]|uniref:TrkA, K+ transport system, NAD-binding component n=1 Tax=Methanohalarchaeum thermophilum TaxID=1903181 RepID=A0A1Q6DSU5_METT1|nr:MAG: TrkA, K+ transport system, NAD-binding component [Candidatus Methanohalarchaeum thermophilum]
MLSFTYFLLLAMYVIVVGAGLIGSSLIEIAVGEGNEVVVVEKDREVAKDIDSSFDCLVINADATDREALEDAGIEDADALITTTERDVVNLVVGLFASEYDVEHVVSLVHDVKNRDLLEDMGITTIENPEKLIAQNLYNSVKLPSVVDFMKVGGEAEIFDIYVEEGAPVDGKTIRDAASENLIPEDINIVSVSRDDEVIIPKGDARLSEGDLVTVLSLEKATEEILNVFKS